MVVPSIREAALKPEDRRSEHILVKGHQSAAWAIKASTASSFFNRAALLWLTQLQERLPNSDSRAHQDLNNIKAALQFSADASLCAARFAFKAIASSISARKMLWLWWWQADAKHKWRLSSTPFAGDNLFGAPLEPMLIESKDKRKILPSQFCKSESRASHYQRRPPFRSLDGEYSFSHPARQYSGRQGQHQDRSGRGGQRYQSKRPYRGAGSNRPFCRQK